MKKKGFSIYKGIKSRRGRALVGVLAGVAALIVISVIMFFVLIVFGASKSLQNTWVCSAMHTYKHQYLATWFFSDEKINEIIDMNSINEDYGDEYTVISNEPFEKITDDTQYIEEGYEKLSDGIFKKKVTGSTDSFNWVGYILLITDPTRVKLAQTSQQFKSGETVMQMVENEDAIAGLNGGGFIDGESYDSDGGAPAGLLIDNKELINPDVDDPEVLHIIGFNDTGHLILKKDVTSWAVSHRLTNAVSFAPFIVLNGKGLVTDGTGGWGISPRSGIAQRETGEVLFIVIDGRQVGYSIGSDLDGLQKIMLDEGCINGAMMDGGSSTAMVYDGSYVNKPSLGHERWVNNCWIVKK